MPACPSCPSCGNANPSYLAMTQEIVRVYTSLRFRDGAILAAPHDTVEAKAPRLLCLAPTDWSDSSVTCGNSWTPRRIELTVPNDS